jgi:phosphatidylserine/phosphatidylglycerophosphate/cardiolipin synthase-like enzyme
MTIAVTFLEQGGQPAAQVAGLLCDFVAAATTSLHVAIYDFRLSEALAPPVVQALRQRAAAGVEVHIAYDAGKPGHPALAGADPAPPGTAEFLRRHLGSAVALKPITGGDPHQPKLMHHKYMIRDGRTPGAALWTGSTNFTDDSFTLQENNVLRIDSPALCAYYETDFSELWLRGDISTTGAHDTGSVQVGGTTVDVAFSPGEGRAIDLEVANRIRAARRRLRIASMLLTSGGILGALADVLHAGRVSDIGGIYDRTQMESVFEQWRGTPADWKRPLFEQVASKLACKCSTPYTPAAPHDFMHNKVVVVDDTVITGSYNLSHSATENAENVLFVTDKDLADCYSATIERLAKRYRASRPASAGG